MFNYSDLELPDFSGTPFDFAELHYKLSGSELLKKLNIELNLRIGKQHHFFSNRTLLNPAKTEEIKPVVHVPKFSYFNAPVSNIHPKNTLSLVEAYNLVKSEEYCTITDQLQEKTAEKYIGQFKDNGLLNHEHNNYTKPVTLNGVERGK